MISHASRSGLALCPQSGQEPARLPMWQALFFFGLPALALRFSLYTGTPRLLRAGVAPLWAYMVTLSTFLALLLVAALMAYRLEGRPLRWLELQRRFRLLPMPPRAWLWAIGGVVAAFLVGGGLLAPSAQRLAQVPLFAPPDSFPALLKPGTSPATLFADAGVALPGNWRLVVAYSIMLALNVVGEELWWRGYILPRQEAVHGRWAWFVHGLLWMLFHLPAYPWQFFALLPICLTIPFVAQRLHSTTPGLVMHFLYNVPPLILIVAGVVGPI